MMKRKGIALILVMWLLCSLAIPAAAAEPVVRTLTLTENWRLTDELDLNVPAGGVLQIDGDNRYFIYEMSAAAVLKNTGAGIVRFVDTMLYHAGDSPQPGSLAELLVSAKSITSIPSPAQGATSLTLPEASGFAVTIKSSSNTSIVGTGGSVVPPSYTTAVSLVLTLTGNGGTADTSNITVVIPGLSSFSAPPSIPSPEPAYSADVQNGASLPVEMNAGGASVDLGSLAASLTNGGNAVVNIPQIPGVNRFAAVLPAASLDGSVDVSLMLNTPLGSLSIPTDMLSGMDFTGEAGIMIGEGDRGSLPDDVKTAIGDRPLIQLTFMLNGQPAEWSNPNAPVQVSIPYTPSEEELSSPEGIVVWYIDGSGNLVSVPNCYYDPVSGLVTFYTTHFSNYAVAYNPVRFDDVPESAWYYKPVSFIAARGITGGTGGGKYSPGAELTRGQFIVMLMRAYDISPDTDQADNFSDAGNAYYTGYLAAAKRLGISAGVGNNMYMPEKEITRQEMFTLLYNALKVIGRLPQGNSGKTFSDFSDADRIALWAGEAMASLVEAGIIAGSGGRLNPANTTTRAEMAQILYALLSK